MDRRERDHKWYHRFDEARMVVIIEEGRNLPEGTRQCEPCGHQWVETDPADPRCPECGSPFTNPWEMDDLEVPVQFAVCGTCDGKGNHVNPSIDSHGLSREDFDEDPDFREAYFRGDYDQPCNECHGRRVVPVVSADAPAELHKLVADRLQDMANYAAEVAAERRMGA